MPINGSSQGLDERRRLHPYVFEPYLMLTGTSCVGSSNTDVPKRLVARSQQTPLPAPLSLLFEPPLSCHAHWYVPRHAADNLVLMHPCSPVRHCPSTSDAHPLPAFNINQCAHQQPMLNMRPYGSPLSLCLPCSPAQLPQQQTHAHAHGFGPWLLSDSFRCIVPDVTPSDHSLPFQSPLQVE